MSRRSRQSHSPEPAGGTGPGAVPRRSRRFGRNAALSFAALAGIGLVAWLAAPAARRTWRGFFGERARLVETVSRLVADAEPEARPLLSACGNAVLEVEDLHPEGVDTAVALARFYERFGAPADAVRQWNRCRGMDPRTAARAGEAVADIALEEGRFADAAAEYAAALAADPAREPVAIHLAEALLGDGRPDEAAASLRGTIARHGRSVAACSLLGQALLQLDDPAAAREELEEAVRLGPDYPAARHALAAACARTGDAAAAAEHREAFAGLQKRKESRHRADLRSKDDIANLRRTLASTLTDAARVHFAHEDGPRGEAALARAMAASPDEPDSRLLLAQLRESQLRHDEAAAAYLEAARVVPDDATRQLVAAAALERLGRMDDAERLLARLVELLPSRPVGYAALSGMLLRTGRDAGRARDLARQAVEREPAEGYWRLLERAARAAGAEAEAETAAREAERAAAK
jgi:predicted Zn-dependent protease